ncbi:MAG TPA: transcription elongation factor GreA [Dehalococcoidia bacterium]|nr:transcription elongation factor GreA [Dehalococcoidia bacterium]
MTNQATTVSEAARRFAHTLSGDQQQYVQEAFRFARWVGEERPVADIRPPDVEAYVESFGLNSPNAVSRAEALKSFLTFAYKQKLMTEKLVTHVRVRRAGGARSKSQAVAEAKQEVHLTAEGLQALTQELEALKAQRPKIALELRDAMADKDFRENAPLDAAREAQGQLEARIRELEQTLRNAVVIQEASQEDTARIGSTVVLQNIASGSKLTYLLVSAREARPNEGRLSVESPVGKAVLGRRAGDEVEVTAPSGSIRFRVESVSG